MTSRFITAPCLAAFGLAALPLAVQAQTPTGNDTTIELNPLVVTATLAPRTADETLSSVTLIDEETLRRQHLTRLSELFRAQPGVDVSSNGSFGKRTTLSIRGTSNDQSVLLIDGIELRSATTGGAAWQFLDPRMFERAEIVRGPRGSLYGADAVGGVVQLFTREAEEGGPRPSITVGGGSFDTHRVSATLSGSEGGTRFSFAGSRFDTEGEPIRRGGEDKGYDNTSGLARVSHAFDNGTELGVLALRSRGNTEFDGGDTDFVQQVAGIHGEVPVTDNLRSRLTLSESRDEQDTFSTFSDSTFDTRTHTARWDNTLTFGFHELIAGIEHEEDEVSGTTDYDESSRDNTAVFAQGLLDFAPLSLQASLRHDDNEAFGEETTGSLALGYDLDGHHTLRASYGTAFRAPTFNELFFPFTDFGSGFTFEGNPDLQPETSESVEFGVRGQHGRWFWDLALFQTDIDNLIVNVDTTDNGSVDTTDNVDRARIRGTELATGAEIDGWTLQAALTYIDPEDRETGNDLPRRASQSLRLDVDRELGDWSLGGSWVAQNHRYDDAENEERLPGFGLLHLRAGWAFAPHWSAKLTVENALDKQYATARDFSGDDYINAGRAAFVSVSFGAR